MEWDRNDGFLGVAKVTWPEDYELAIVWKATGRAEARRRMQHRYEGFRAVDGLQREARIIRKILEPIASGAVRAR